MSREGQKLVEIDDKGRNRSKGSISRQHFSETEKRRLFPHNYELKKFKPIHSIFTYQNGKSETNKMVMAKLELKDANFSVPHPPKSQKQIYVKFQWDVNLN